jgi:hypothetical protein
MLDNEVNFHGSVLFSLQKYRNCSGVHKARERKTVFGEKFTGQIFMSHKTHHNL